MLSDWESSLTELSSDEDTYAPAPKKAKAKTKAKAKAKEEYKVTNLLQPYRTTTYTAQSLYDQIVDNTVQLDPEYQRDVVWTEAKQVGLIDSLLRNFYIPPVIFAVQRRDDGSETRTCIDGKQRLTSIQLFMDGTIPHRDNATNKKYWCQERAGEKRAILPKPLLAALSNKQIVCVEYDNLTDDQEREIFQRVQLGVALTPAERLQAIPGPWPTLIREVQSIVLGEDGFGEDLDWGTDRGKDFQCLATIILLIDAYPNTAYPGVQRLEKWLYSSSPIPAKTRQDVLDTFRIFITLVKDKKYNAAFSKPGRVSPVEFTMIGVLISHFCKTHSLKQLSQAIWRMRADVRSHHEDIRQNSKVLKTMFQFIAGGLDDLDLVGDGKGDVPAAVAIKPHKAPVAKPVPLPAKDKRRRHQDTESSTSEYEEVAPKKRPSLSSSRFVAKITSATTSSAKPKGTTTKKAATATTSKMVEKAPPKTSASARATKANATTKTSPASTPQSSTPAPKASTSRLTTRNTRTALSAAAESLSLYETPGPSKVTKQTKKAAAVSPLPQTPVPAESSTVEPRDIVAPAPVVPDAGSMAPANGSGGGTGSGDPDAMQVDEPVSGSSVQNVPHPIPLQPPAINTASLLQAAASQTSQSPSTASTSGDQVFQASLEQLLAMYGHLGNIPNALSQTAIKQASATPPFLASSGANLSAQPPTSMAVPAVPPPPPLPSFTVPGLAHVSPLGSTSAMALPTALSSQLNPGSQSASSQLPVVIKRERDSYPKFDSDWDMDRSRDRDRSRTRERSRDRDRSRDRYRSTGRDRTRSRSRHRSRSRDRSRDRYRSKGRRSRDRTRSRSRSRSRDRDRSRNGERSGYRNSGKTRDRDWDRDRDGYRGGGRGGDRDRRSRGYHR